jgi:hypothetical protein
MEDYGIISRILPQDGTSALISMAGLGQYGTLAATEFVSDPDRIGDFNRMPPGDGKAGTCKSYSISKCATSSLTHPRSSQSTPGRC